MNSNIFLYFKTMFTNFKKLFATQKKKKRKTKKKEKRKILNKKGNTGRKNDGKRKEKMVQGRF